MTETMNIHPLFQRPEDPPKIFLRPQDNLNTHRLLETSAEMLISLFS